jgi:hypothetical protein
MNKLLLISLLLSLLLLGVSPTLAQDQSTVTLLHFSDYHSHAVPFYGEGEANTAGIARLIAYLKPLADDPNVLIFSGTSCGAIPAAPAAPSTPSTSAFKSVPLALAFFTTCFIASIV